MEAVFEAPVLWIYDTLSQGCLVPVRRFPGPLGQFTSVKYPRRTGGKHFRLDHVTRNASAARNNEAWGQGKSQGKTRTVISCPAMVLQLVALLTENRIETSHCIRENIDENNNLN